MNRCIYPGSFDGLTYGHLDIINRACKTFDEVIVGIGVNPSKKYTFSVKERTRFIEHNVSFPEKVKVHSFEGLLADFAYEIDVKTVIKGVRNVQDFDYERLLHEVTITQQAGIDTHILIADQKLSHISSSAAKELCKYQGLIDEYVPYDVKQALEYEINGQIIIGITGSTGMGKSYITEKLIKYYSSKHPVLHVDLDKIAHELYTRSEPVYKQLQHKIAATFGLTSVSSVEDRKKLGSIVFNDDDALKTLNNYVRNPILTLMRKQMYGFKGIIFLNGALLVEANFLPLCNNNVVVVNMPVDSQIENLKNRGLSTTQIQRRINCQLSNSAKISKIRNAIVEKNYGSCICYNNSIGDTQFENLVNDINLLIYTR